MIFPKTRPFLFLIGSCGTLCIPPISYMEPFFIEPTDLKSHASVKNILQQNAKIPVTFLIDTLETDLRNDTLPPLGYFDRRNLMARRLHQTFPHAIYKKARTAKNGRILMAALHESKTLQSWLSLIAEAGNDLEGLYLLPLEGSSILEKFLPETRNGWGLLFTQQRASGWRQIVTHNSFPIFTRLTPFLAQDAKPDETAAMIGHEIQTSIAYLSRWGLANADDLSVLAFVSENTKKALEKISLPFHKVLLRTPCDAAEDLDLAFWPEEAEPTSDLIFAGQFLKSRKKFLRLLPAATEGRAHENRIKSLGSFLAASVWLLTLASISMQTSSLYKVWDAGNEKLNAVAQVRRDIDDTLRDLSPQNTSIGKLREALARRRLFAESSPTPWELFDSLAEALGSDARAISLTWKNESGKIEDETLLLTLRLISPQKINVSSREDVINRFRELATRIKQEVAPNYEVRVERYPFPVLPEETLSGQMNAQEEKNNPTADLILRRIQP